MKEILQPGPPSKIRKAGAIYTDTKTGKSYKQNKVPRGNEWSSIDDSGLSSSSSPDIVNYDFFKIYSASYVIFMFNLSFMNSSPVNFGTISTLPNARNILFLNCSSVFNLDGDVPFDSVPSSYQILDNNTSDVMFQTYDPVLFENYGGTVQNGVSNWLTNDDFDRNVTANSFNSTAQGIKGNINSVDLAITADADPEMFSSGGFGYLTINITYALI